MNNHIKYIARFKVEAKTPISVGQGDKGLTVDKLVAKDANDLPYIPGTSLAGVIKHELEEKSPFAAIVEKLFGYQGTDNDGQGSRIVFSSAHLLAADGEKVIEGLELIDFESDDFYANIKRLPDRDHVRINDRGTAVERGKYEEELVRKGCRFVFEIELSGTEQDDDVWNYILDLINHATFRVGAGTRKGFGALEVVECMQQRFDLKDFDQLEAYLNKGSSLNKPFADWKNYKAQGLIQNRWVHYHLEIKPENFFLFGAGIGELDEQGKELVDNSPKTERYFDWTSGKAQLSEEQILIPATSIKGAIAHRVAFHYNALTKSTIEDVVQVAFNKEFDAQEMIANYDFGDDISMITSSEDPKWKELEKSIEQKAINSIDDWKHYTFSLDMEAEEKISPTNTGEQNKAVAELFGFAKVKKVNKKEDKEKKKDNEMEKKDNEKKESKNIGARGKVVFSDVYKTRDRQKEKVFNHVAIDRFTGGGIDGALFQEKVVHSEGFELDIFVEQDVLEKSDIKKAFELALTDLTTGLLPLGGNTMKGHGVFTGNWSIKTEN